MSLVVGHAMHCDMAGVPAWAVPFLMQLPLHCGELIKPLLGGESDSVKVGPWLYALDRRYDPACLNPAIELGWVALAGSGRVVLTGDLYDALPEEVRLKIVQRGLYAY